LKNYDLGKLRSWEIPRPGGNLLIDQAARRRRNMFTTQHVQDAANSQRHIHSVTGLSRGRSGARSRASIFFKHYTLAFDVKAASLTDISMEEPAAQVAMRHELRDRADEMIQR
jgi:hypothetical protein